MSWQTGNPPKSGRYLATTRRADGSLYVQTVVYDADRDDPDELEVIAWQPLPEPYRVEEATE